MHLSLSLYRVFALFLLMAVSTGTMAQRNLPAQYPSNATINYVRTWNAAAPETDPNTLTTRPLKDVKQTTDYVDGLGRPLQTVVKQGSFISGGMPGGIAFDMVSAVEYDAFGRETYKYLSFAANTTGANTSVSDGLFKYNPFQQQAAFYNTQLSGQTGETNVGANGLNWAYSKTNYEASSVDRVMDMYAAGSSWVGSENNTDPGTRRNVSLQYLVNDAFDQVHTWTGSGNTFSTSSTALYPAGALFEIVTIDEEKKKVVEYKDKEGLIILKKVQISATPSQDHAGWLCTYYVYDEYNNLRMVVQPQGVELLMVNNWDINALNGDILNEQCFQYEYDHRDRLIRKKMPGAGEIWMVYDKWDRVVLTQDANLRAQAQKKWLFTKYDQLNRPIVTGFYTNNTYTTQAAMQTYLDAQNMARFENYQTATYPLYSLNQSFPVVVLADVLTFTYYDDYSWGGWYGDYGTKENSFDSEFPAASNSGYPYPQPLTQSLHTKGLVTGVWQSTGSGLLLATYYDNKGRIIQTKQYNYTSGIDITTTQYSFDSRPLQTVLRHQKLGTNAQTHKITTLYNYDVLNRLSAVKKVINSTVNGQTITSPETFVLRLEYDALGQLKTKRLKGTPTEYGQDQYGMPLFVEGIPAVETLEYDFNIRGWLLGVNRNYLADNGTGRYFGFELGYDKTGNKANRSFTDGKYNGNINGMLWKSTGDDIQRKYDFTYDAASRLLKGEFEQHNTDNSWNNAQVNYNVKMGDGVNPALAYDANGNILRMQQWGLKVTGSAQLDDLRYTYYTNGNKLRNVVDFNNDPDTKLGDFRTSVNHPQKNDKTSYVANPGSVNINSITDYTYDVNGNLKKDLNKDIGTGSAEDIHYNHLNLPELITLRTSTGGIKGTITYTYDQDGNKIKKVTVDNSTAGKTITTTATYLGGAVYESRTTQNPGPEDPADYTDKLQFIAHEEGRIRFTAAEGANPTRFNYDFFIKDHLGNVRMVLTDEQPPASIYQASMEEALRGFEVQLFGEKVNTTDDDKPGGFDNLTENQKVSVLNGTTAEGRVGPGLILKVMAGDKIKARTYAWYLPTGMDNTTDPGLPAIINNLLGQLVPGVSGAGKGSIAAGVTNSILQPGMQSLLGTQAPLPNAPRAYLNWVLLDEEQFKMVSGGVVPVPEIAGSTQKQLLQANGGNDIEMTKNGYLYVYVSNESKGNVYFDDIRIEYLRGPLLEETHYYPFGLVMAGISSKAAGVQTNKEQTFQEQRFDGDIGLNWIPFKWRTHDPQIGRFLQIDPLSDDYRYQSLYNFSENRVIDGRELEGLEYVSIHHYADGTNGIKMHYRSTDKEINKIQGTTSGIYNAASYGPLGKGVIHYYYNGDGSLDAAKTRWDNQRVDAATSIGNHGLYSGPGCVTGRNGDYDFSYQPIDWADAIAKRHDMDYAAVTSTGEPYAGYLEDIRTVQADRDMIARVRNIISDINHPTRRNHVAGVEIPFRTSSSGEMRVALDGQLIVISALATYKQWKIDNNYTNRDTYIQLRDRFFEYDPITATIIDLINPN
jgi:RHS repeat-associated protein